MKWLRYVIVALISFGLGITFAYLTQGPSTFESIKNFIAVMAAGGSSLGLVIKGIDIIIERLKERKAERAKKREKLEGYLQDHYRDLVIVISKWFAPELTFEFLVPGGKFYSTPLAKAYYEPHFKSNIEKPNEPNLKYIDQAIQHLQAKEYADVWAIWLECKRLTESNLEKVVKIWENIEKKLVGSLQAKFTEWDARGVNPPNCYILDNTVWEIYRECENFKRTGKLEDTSFKKYLEKDSFRIGTATLFAISLDESLADEFIYVAHSIIRSENILVQNKSLEAEKKLIDNLVEKFRQALDKIVDDFEKGHIDLKGTCKRCKSWHDQLASLR
jgi:hypothetical protein